MVRDAFLTNELVHIDCQGLERSDYKKIGCKLRVSPSFALVCLHSCECHMKKVHSSIQNHD